RLATPTCPENAMEKQPACTAAISSSGVVPGVFSNRVANEYGVLYSTPLLAETTPLPSFRPPFQIALALRCIRLSWSGEVDCVLAIVDGAKLRCQATGQQCLADRSLTLCSLRKSGQRNLRKSGQRNLRKSGQRNLRKSGQRKKRCSLRRR